LVKRFLNCIAQLLSPCKRWDWVTAAAIREGEEEVVVDITRNNGFVSDEDNEIMSYCKMLEKYLDSSTRAGMGSNMTATSLSKFQLNAINYMVRRIYYWVQDLQKTLKTSQVFPDWNSQRWLGQEAEVESWTTMTDLLRQFNTDKETNRHNTRSKKLTNVSNQHRFDNYCRMPLGQRWLEALEPVKLYCQTTARLQIIGINSCSGATIWKLQNLSHTI
ncbi:hypothetical protein N7490_006342, partial [Penicillium lividum]